MKLENARCINILSCTCVCQQWEHKIANKLFFALKIHAFLMARSVKTTKLKKLSSFWFHCIVCRSSMNLWPLCEYYSKIIRWIIVVRAYKMD